MTPAEADQRIILSRKTQWAMAGAFANGDMIVTPETLAQITAEVVILRQLAAEFPGKADKIANLIERYVVMARHMRERMN